MVVGGLVALLMMGIWVQTGMPGFGMGGMMGGLGMMSSSVMWGAGGVMSAISVGLGTIVIVGGYSMQRSPESASKWGVAILIASIVGLFSISGFFIGPILGIIGGVLALTRK